MRASALLLVVYLIHDAVGFYTLRQLSYTQLPTSISRGNYLYSGLNLGTAKDAAYDFVNNIVYVIGETSHFMHVIDIADPSNPQLLFVHQFTKGEGVPMSIDVCDHEVAVALAAQTDTNEGHVRYYHTYTKGSGATDMVLDGYVTVGQHPSHIKFTPDCSITIVTNEGLAGKDEGKAYVDPEGSVTIIYGEKTGNPSVKRVDFDLFNTGEANYNPNLRVPSLYVPTATHSPRATVAQDIEPEKLTITADGRTAFVTLQENNAIAEISISTGIVTAVTPLPRKDWSAIPIDVSDRDGGVHRRVYSGLRSLRQPGMINCMTVGNRKFLFTADEGAKKTFTSALHGFNWNDNSVGRTISSQIEPAELKTNAANDEFLGRLQVSTIDGKSSFTQMYEHLEAFGGRGISIWDTKDLTTPVFDSEGTFEEYMEAYDKSVFNCDYVKNTAAYQSPEILRDTVSDNQGAQVTGLDVADDNGTVFMAAGTWTTGTVYLYTVDTSSGQPIPQFQSINRGGTKDLPWNDLYTNKTAGDLYISDLGIITSDHSPIDRPLLYVVGSGSGALSVYEIVQETPIIPGG